LPNHYLFPLFNRLRGTLLLIDIKRVSTILPAPFFSFFCPVAFEI
jgi:hypothetical protein